MLIPERNYFPVWNNVRVNERGNTLYCAFFSADRYYWDFNKQFKKDGWLQYDTDQDAHYFGVWVNPRWKMVFSYVEGDIILCVCQDTDHYFAEIRSMNEFYGEGFIAKTIDENGNMTVYSQDRNEFLKLEEAS